MVGPGTGVVPFIAFNEEREMIQKEGKPIAEGHLFFGCRQAESDFIYRDELAAWEDKKIITPYYAFSRPKEGPKHYVQHLLKEKTDLIERLLRKESGQLYICGATKMGADVQTVVKEVLGEDYFKQMEKEKRIVVELWSS